MLAVVVHAATFQDQDRAKLVRAKVAGAFPRLQQVWADGDNAGQLITWVQALGRWILESVKRSDDVAGFEVVPKLLIVERTFARLKVLSFEQRLRSQGRDERDDDVSRDDPLDAPTPKTTVTTLCTHFLRE